MMCRFVTTLGHPVEWVEEENYKFKMSLFKEHLEKWLTKSPPPMSPKHRYVLTICHIIYVNTLTLSIYYAVIRRPLRHILYIYGLPTYSLFVLSIQVG